MADTRSVSWACVIYPESLPADWLDRLTNTFIQIAISPLHDRDYNADGELKKPHYHVVMCFGTGTKKSYDQVMTILEEALGNGFSPCQAIRNIKGYVRYLVHMDNPEKAQYSQVDIKCLGGFDYAQFLKVSGNDRYLVLQEIIDYIDKEQITEFRALVNFCSKNNFEWFKVIADSSILVREYITSLRNSKKL